MNIGKDIEIYRFMDGDVNPTVKKIGADGKFTSEIYNKDDVISSLKEAIEKNNINSIIKETNSDDEYIKYNFNVGNDDKIFSTISIQIKDNNIGTIPIEATNLIKNPENINFTSKYISILENMVTEHIRVKNRKTKEKILAMLAGGISLTLFMGGMVMAFIKTDMDEQENIKNQNREYINDMNDQRYKNGLQPIQYAGLEQIVDDAIEESRSNGRKL